MKSIFNKLKSIFNLNQNQSQNTEEQVSCNYSDNYYGDQYCQPK